MQNDNVRHWPHLMKKFKNIEIQIRKLQKPSYHWINVSLWISLCGKKGQLKNFKLKKLPSLRLLESQGALWISPHRCPLHSIATRWRHGAHQEHHRDPVPMDIQYIWGSILKNKICLCLHMQNMPLAKFQTIKLKK